MAARADKSLLVIGECMMELSGTGDTYRRTFAGDTFNSAVYAKRRAPEIDVQMLTAVGTDAVSAAMLEQWAEEQIGQELVLTSAERHPGIYAIATDDTGERSFTYWRDHSAATETMRLMSAETLQRISRFDWVYFSGISLAIFQEEDKSRLLKLIADCRSQGKIVAFDPNYRPKLWDSVEHARHWISEAYALCDIALPGLADHQDIFAHEGPEDIHAFLHAANVREIVVKADTAGVFAYAEGELAAHLPLTPTPDPRDTTGAGDSFAGTYLADRINGLTIADAVRNAAKIAALVVQHPGAIVDPAIYQHYVQTTS